MDWKWLWKLLLPILGDILVKYVVPLAKPKIKSTLDKVLPVAERWVAAVETTNLSGTQKYQQAFDHIRSQCTEQKIGNVAEGVIDTAIQLAWVKLGLDEKPA